MPQRACSGCGALYWADKASGKPRSRCPECAPPTVRDSCGTWAGYMAHGKAKEGACDPCMNAARAYSRESASRRYEARPKQRFKCRQCDKTFWHAHPLSAYCSSRCRNRWINKNKRREGQPPPSHRQSRWSYRQMKSHILERDSWVCQLCRLPIPKDQDYDPYDCDLYPSIDHIVPRSEGGTDDDWNLQAAHWICNVRKGAGRLGSQLLLPMGGE